MAKQNVEPSRPSVEAILTDIHNTLIEGFDNLITHIKDVKEEIQILHEQLLGSPQAAAEAAVEVVPEEKPRKKDRPETTLHVDGKGKNGRGEPTEETKPVEVKDAPKAEKPKITIEMLREKITEVMAISSNDALAINEKFGGSRKLSAIPEVKYEAVFLAMEDYLKAKAAPAEEPKPEEPEAPAVTKEDIQRAGGDFVKEYGDPAFRELLKKFVAKGEEPRISKVDPAKYPALFEALSNA